MNPTLKERFESIQERIKKSSSVSPFSQNVTLIAASKGQSAAKIKELYDMGQRDFGENYVQELLKKRAEVSLLGCSAIRWHLIGHLQSNKVRQVAGILSSVHSVDSIKLAKEIHRQCDLVDRNNALAVFIEVNIDGESSKTGVNPDQVAELAHAISGLNQLRLMGLMCMPDPARDARSSFERVAKLKDSLDKSWKLSVGMSSDFEEAIMCGSSYVRVGTALFGARPG